MRWETYKKDQESGIKQFSIATNSFLLEYWNNKDNYYLYTYETPGKQDVEEMKKLAKAGKGLKSHVNKVVRDNYTLIKKGKELQYLKQKGLFMNIKN